MMRILIALLLLSQVAWAQNAYYRGNTYVGSDEWVVEITVDSSALGRTVVGEINQNGTIFWAVLGDTATYSFGGNIGGQTVTYGLNGARSVGANPDIFAARPVQFTRTFTRVQLDEGEPVPESMQYKNTGVFKVYPPGTDLDDVDPLPVGQEVVNIDARFDNRTQRDIDMRLLVNGELIDEFVLEGQQNGPIAYMDFRYTVEGLFPGSTGTFEFEYKDENGNWVTVEGEKAYTGPVEDIPQSVPFIDKVFQDELPDYPTPDPKPTPRPSPTPAPTPSGSLPKATPSATPVPPKNTNHINYNGGSGPNGEVTQADIYEAMKLALENADVDRGLDSDMGDFEESTGDLDGAQESFDGIADRTREVTGASESMVESLVGKVDALGSSLNTVPASFGYRPTYQLPSYRLPAGGTVGPFTINFDDWGAPMIRSISLWVLRFAFFLMMMRAFNAK